MGAGSQEEPAGQSEREGGDPWESDAMEEQAEPR